MDQSCKWQCYFWAKMKLVEEKAIDTEQSYIDLVSAASNISHFDYQFPSEPSVGSKKMPCIMMPCQM
jgi:hypothetical protein